MTFATLRLGKTSVDDIRLIDAQEGGILAAPMSISVVCTQVPADLVPGMEAGVQGPRCGQKRRTGRKVQR